MNLQIQNLARQIAEEKLEKRNKAVTDPVTFREPWLVETESKPEVIAEAHTRYAVEQKRIEHADCDRCNCIDWMNCEGPYTETELATRAQERQAVIAADAEILETHAAEERALAKGFHGFRARPDKPGTCSRQGCGEAFDAEIHDMQAMAAA